MLKKYQVKYALRKYAAILHKDYGLLFADKNIVKKVVERAETGEKTSLFVNDDGFIEENHNF